MKIRPKPRKYNNEDIDESYFATKSDENSRSRDEETPDGDQDKSEFFKTSSRVSGLSYFHVLIECYGLFSSICGVEFNNYIIFSLFRLGQAYF